AGQVESQIEQATLALRALDEEEALAVRDGDRQINEAQAVLRERCFAVISQQRPDDRQLRLLISIQYISLELERMGDYAVRIARRTGMLAQLSERRPLRAEFGLMGELATQQVRDILDALIEVDTERARAVAAQDTNIDRLYERVFDDVVQELGCLQGEGGPQSDQVLRIVTLLQVAHDLERIGDRVTNVAEDIVFLDTGEVVELG
ncbi:MAG: phosphate signaling complex protein PhoU, partial [Candidatus Dormibacteraeota bacterium]|nr:phosphate signaling complex protein PhoU [Candidatus Dormibacteraeota bacterium]